MFATYLQFCAQASPLAAFASQFMAKYYLGDRAGIDHICYKCGSSAEYEFARSVLELHDVSSWLEQEWISGRRVSYFRLKNPLKAGAWTISFVELQDFQHGAGDQAGFHHVEIYPLEGVMDYRELIEVLGRRGEKLVYSYRIHHSTYDIMLSNPSLIIRISDGPLVKRIAQKMWGGV